MRGNAGRAGIFIALQGLDATHGQHHAPAAVAQIGAQTQALDQMKAGKNLSRSNNLDLPFQIKTGQTIADKGDGVHQRHADGIAVLHRRRAGAAFAAVHGDKIRSDAGYQHGFAQGHEFTFHADTNLEAHWFSAGQLAQLLNKQHHLHRIGKGRMGGGRINLRIRFNAPDFGYFGRVFTGMQDAAVSGFCALRQFDFNHLDRLARRVFRKQVFVKSA